MKLSIILAYLIPTAVFAADVIDGGGGRDIQSFVANLKSNVLNPLIGLRFVLATVVFLWGVIQYSLLAESDEKLAAARQQMTWGIIGLTVMSAAWGLVKIICNTFDISGC